MLCAVSDQFDSVTWLCCCLVVHASSSSSSLQVTLFTVCCALCFCLLQRAVIAAYLELVAELPWQTLSSERLVLMIITASHSRVCSSSKRFVLVMSRPMLESYLVACAFVLLIHNSISLAATRRQLDADHHGLEPIKVSNLYYITECIRISFQYCR
jgi:hypothetical protein